MSWADVEVTEEGEDIVALLRGEARRIEDRIYKGALDALREWRVTVLRSTWFHPRPSPESQIIARIVPTSGGIVLEYGWINYSGDQAKAAARAELREQSARPVMLELIGAALAAGGP